MYNTDINELYPLAVHFNPSLLLLRIPPRSIGFILSREKRAEYVINRQNNKKAFYKRKRGVITEKTRDITFTNRKKSFIIQLKIPEGKQHLPRQNFDKISFS